jgi:hypothetical protein
VNAAGGRPQFRTAGAEQVQLLGMNEVRILISSKTTKIHEVHDVHEKEEDRTEHKTCMKANTIKSGGE